MDDCWVYAVEVCKSKKQQIAEFERFMCEGIVVYGAGFLGMWAITYLKSIGAKILCLVDSNCEKWGAIVQGIPVVAPNDLLAKGSIPVIITARHAIIEIADELQSNGIYSVSFDTFFAVRNFEQVRDIRNNFLHDEKSRAVLSALIMGWLTGSSVFVKQVMEGNQYFCMPGFADDAKHIYVDAGAYVGDTVEKFIWACNGAFKRIYAFEPGKRQFFALKTRVDRLISEWAIESDQIVIENLGVSSVRGVVRCVNQSGLAQSLNMVAPTDCQASVETANVCSLDEYLNGQEITLIKSDVEGMELALLHGAVESIRKYSPKLAISIYHLPTDIFEIPMFIRSISPDYQFAIRHHSSVMMETVLYCWKV